MEKLQANLTNIQLYVGIDVHKRQWSVTILSDHVEHSTFSQQPYPDTLKCYLDKHFPGASVSCAYEASKFGFWIQRKLSEYGYQCMVVNPADIPTTNRDKVTKTDPIDSRKIANCLRSGLLKPIYVPSIDAEGDRQLFRYRKRLWGDLVKVKNRIKDKLMFAGVPLPPKHDNSFWTKDFISWLQQVALPSTSTRMTLDLLLEQYHMIYRHFQKVSTQVRKLQKKARYKQDAKLLKGIPGIGPLTTVQLLTEIEDVNRFPDFKHLNSFIGIKPTTHASGEHDWNGRMTYRQHKGLRSALVECAWVSIRKDPALLVRYEQLVKRLTAKRAIIVIARKLLSRIYHVLKTKEEYALGVMK